MDKSPIRTQEASSRSSYQFIRRYIGQPKPKMNEQAAEIQLLNHPRINLHLQSFELTNSNEINFTLSSDTK